MSARRRVLVIGGGLAGIAAALDCADAGAHVTLVEVRRRLGGAAYSFERDGMRFDNGQHVFLRCCAAYRALLARLGSEHHVAVQERLEIPVLSPRAPARRAAPRLAAAAVSPRRRARALPAPDAVASASARRSPRARSAPWTRATPRSTRQTFGAWLAEHGQDAHAVERAVGPDRAAHAQRARRRRPRWRSARSSFAPACSPAPTPATSAFTSARSPRRSASRPSARWPTPASSFASAGAPRRLRRAGAGFEVRGRGGRLQRRGGDRRAAARPRGRADRAAAAGSSPRRSRGLGSSPIVNLHVVYDRVVCEEPFAAGVDTPVQYLFDRSAAAGAPAGLPVPGRVAVGRRRARCR